jgi:hypothetical protein
VRLLLGAATIGLLFISSQPAEAMLTYDLRLVGGGKSVTTANGGQVIQLELYAVVTRLDGSTLNEGFQDGWLDIVSSNGGNVRGNLSATLASPFADNGSQNGVSQDLDGDGDKDLGSASAFLATPSHDANYLFARSATMDTTGIAITNGQEFKLATITFTVTNIVSASNSTPIHLSVVVPNFTSPIDLEAVWQEDGQSSSNSDLHPGGTFPNSFPVAGTDVLIAAPEPGTALLVALGMLACAARRRRTPGVRT